jgi:hypothetical protein
MNKDMVDQVVDVAQRVVQSGAISANGHGNVSLRVPGTDEMYFTGGPSLRNHPAEAVARVGLVRPQPVSSCSCVDSAAMSVRRDRNPEQPGDQTARK